MFWIYTTLCPLVKCLVYPFPNKQILDSYKLKEFEDDNFEFNEKSRVLQRKKILWEKEKFLIMSNFSFSHSVFKILVLQTL